MIYILYFSHGATNYFSENFQSLLCLTCLKPNESDTPQLLKCHESHALKQGNSNYCQSLNIYSLHFSYINFVLKYSYETSMKHYILSSNKRVMSFIKHLSSYNNFVSKHSHEVSVKHYILWNNKKVLSFSKHPFITFQL